MKHLSTHYPHIPFFASVRVRLTLWYLAVMTIILTFICGSLYASQMVFNTQASESQLNSQLHQDTQRLENIYKNALLQGATPSTRTFALADQEIVLLLDPAGAILDSRGPLTEQMTQLLQAQVNSDQTTIDITSSQSHTNNWHQTSYTYSVLITSVLNQNSRIAILMVGLVRNYAFPLLLIWFFHTFMGLLAVAIGGYWLAGKALRPVKTMTHTAHEISATDLHRRLDLKRRDEFGALAATFNQMLDRLEAAFKRQAQFTTDASHELRTPLTIIDLEINRALHQLPMSEENRQVLEQIRTENEQMGTIVNDLLLLARADTGQIILHREILDLSDLTLTDVERLLPLARQSQIKLATGNLPELLISGDAHHLSRMLTNLLENAIKYTRGVGKRVYIELACEQPHWGVIRIQDDGPGIAPEHLPYLFDRFYRVDKARARKRQNTTTPTDDEPGGTGLGLSIAQWVAQAHGGIIHVESTVGSGTLFEIRLPLFKEA